MTIRVTNNISFSKVTRSYCRLNKRKSLFILLFYFLFSLRHRKQNNTYHQITSQKQRKNIFIYRFLFYFCYLYSTQFTQSGSEMNTKKEKKNEKQIQRKVNTKKSLRLRMWKMRLFEVNNRGKLDLDQ